MSKVAQRRDPHTGTVISRLRKGRTVWIMRLLLRDGTRKEVTCPYGFNREQAEKRAKEFQAKEDAVGLFYAAKMKAIGVPVEGETADEWHARMLPIRAAARKTRDADELRLQWKNYVSPFIGSRPLAAVTRADVLAVRDHLDALTIAGTIRGKTAINIWSCVKVAFSVACSTKGWAKPVRVREDDPTLGVESVDDGPSRKRQFIYPKEFAQLMACHAVPLERRFLYCVAVYLGTRPDETAALRWGTDIDLEGGVVRISRAVDWATKTEGRPKTDAGIRTIPIEATLLPVLKAFEGASGTLVAPLALKLGKNDAAPMFRRDLQTAGVLSPRLWAKTSTHMPVDYRCLRDSYACWHAIAGLDTHKLMRRMGHGSITTSLGYAKVAESMSDIGTPFGELSALLESLQANVARYVASKGRDVKTPACEEKREWAGRDLNPGPTD
jgi:integrase